MLKRAVMIRSEILNERGRMTDLMTPGIGFMVPEMVYYDAHVNAVFVLEKALFGARSPRVGRG